MYDKSSESSGKRYEIEISESKNTWDESICSMHGLEGNNACKYILNYLW